MGSLVCLAHLIYFSIASECFTCVFEIPLQIEFVMILVRIYTNACLSFERCFEKNVNFVMIRVWMYTKYCLLESLF